MQKSRTYLTSTSRKLENGWYELTPITLAAQSDNLRTIAGVVMQRQVTGAVACGRGLERDGYRAIGARGHTRAAIVRLGEITAHSDARDVQRCGACVAECDRLVSS